MSSLVEKVFEPVGDLFEDIYDGLEDIVESDVFKVVAVGAAVYFGGAGLLSMGNGGGFMAGVSNASSTWSGALGMGTSAASGAATGVEAGVAAAETAAVAGAETIGATAAAETVGTAAIGAEGAVAGMTAGDAMWAGAKLTAATQGAGMAVKAYGEHEAEKERKKEFDNRQYFGMNRKGEGGPGYTGMSNVSQYAATLAPGQIANRPGSNVKRPASSAPRQSSMRRIDQTIG